MRAVVWHGVGDVRLEEVPDPIIQDPTQDEALTSAVDACATFDRREAGWTKVVLEPGS